MSGLLLGVRMSLYNFQRIKIENVDFQKKIGEFKVDVSEKANIPKDSLELVYRGNVLDDEHTLVASGLKPGVMVHVLKKKIKDPPRAAQPMSPSDVQALVVAFRTLILNPSYKHALQKLSCPDILDSIIMITPGLSQDPVAISMIQDPELLVRMGDHETVKRIVELHPALAEAANHIAAAVHEEALISGTHVQPSSSSGGGFSHLLDFFSDEDDMESSQVSSSSGFSNVIDVLDENELARSESSDSIPQGGAVSRQQSFSCITAAQVAAALASASQGAAQALGSGSADGAGAAGSSAGITHEMFSQAMQRAIASVTPPASSGGASQAPPSWDSPVASAPSEEGPGDLTEQMRQMRELGLTDDAINLQALQIAGGNVHAAVDLVFSGAITSNPP